MACSDWQAQDVTARIIACFYDVYHELGHGFLEAVYSRSLLIALHNAGLRCEREVPVDVYFRGEKVGHYRVDLLVENRVVVEVKAGRAPDASDESQLLHYLRATRLEVGLLLYFGPQPKVRRRISTGRDPRKQVNPT